MQTFRTKIFLSLSDDFSARTASELCGREDQLKVSYSLSESGHDTKVSWLTGKALSHKANIIASKSYNTQSDYRFDMKTFTELRNAQSVTIAYDGLNPTPPMFCYLKPYYNDPNDSYFRAARRRSTLMNGFEMILPFLKPIEHLILDDSISEVMVNGPDRVFIEKTGFPRSRCRASRSAKSPSWSRSRISLGVSVTTSRNRNPFSTRACPMAAASPLSSRRAVLAASRSPSASSTPATSRSRI